MLYTKRTLAPAPQRVLQGPSSLEHAVFELLENFATATLSPGQRTQSKRGSLEASADMFDYARPPPESDTFSPTKAAVGDDRYLSELSELNLKLAPLSYGLREGAGLGRWDATRSLYRAS